MTVYRRNTSSGGVGFMVANYADGERRRFDSYATETDALEAANTLAKRLDKRDYVAASMTKEQAIEYASALQSLQPFKISLAPAVATLTEALGGIRNFVFGSVSCSTFSPSPKAGK